MERIQFEDDENINNANGNCFYLILEGKKIFKHLF